MSEKARLTRGGRLTAARRSARLWQRCSERAALPAAVSPLPPLLPQKQNARRASSPARARPSLRCTSSPSTTARHQETAVRAGTRPAMRTPRLPPSAEAEDPRPGPRPGPRRPQTAPGRRTLDNVAVDGGPELLAGRPVPVLPVDDPHLLEEGGLAALPRAQQQDLDEALHSLPSRPAEKCT
uniref:Uncharacterized protein n=1 Tax=Gallus gallus TaxID=9031 RepID=A0A8V1ALY4_CHICK